MTPWWVILAKAENQWAYILFFLSSIFLHLALLYTLPPFCWTYSLLLLWSWVFLQAFFFWWQYCSTKGKQFFPPTLGFWKTPILWTSVFLLEKKPSIWAWDLHLGEISWNLLLIILCPGILDYIGKEGQAAPMISLFLLFFHILFSISFLWL